MHWNFGGDMDYRVSLLSIFRVLKLTDSKNPPLHKMCGYKDTTNHTSPSNQATQSYWSCPWI